MFSSFHGLRENNSAATRRLAGAVAAFTAFRAAVHASQSVQQARYQLQNKVTHIGSLSVRTEFDSSRGRRLVLQSRHGKPLDVELKQLWFGRVRLTDRRTGQSQVLQTNRPIVVNGTNGNDQVNASGLKTIGVHAYLGGGRNFLIGGGGNDRGRSSDWMLMSGRGGNDLYFSGVNGGVFFGGADDDTAHGNRGKLDLFGGPGSDKFYLNGAKPRVVTDFHGKSFRWLQEYDLSPRQHISALTSLLVDLAISATDRRMTTDLVQAGSLPTEILSSSFKRTSKSLQVVNAKPGIDLIDGVPFSTPRRNHVSPPPSAKGSSDSPSSGVNGGSENDSSVKSGNFVKLVEPKADGGRYQVRKFNGRFDIWDTQQNRSVYGQTHFNDVRVEFGPREGIVVIAERIPPRRFNEPPKYSLVLYDLKNDRQIKTFHQIHPNSAWGFSPAGNMFLAPSISSNSLGQGDFIYLNMVNIDSARSVSKPFRRGSLSYTFSPNSDVLAVTSVHNSGANETLTVSLFNTENLQLVKTQPNIKGFGGIRTTKSRHEIYLNNHQVIPLSPILATGLDAMSVSQTSERLLRGTPLTHFAGVAKNSRDRGERFVSDKRLVNLDKIQIENPRGGMRRDLRLKLPDSSLARAHGGSGVDLDELRSAQFGARDSGMTFNPKSSERLGNDRGEWLAS